jgi:GxxExxY protein
LQHQSTTTEDTDTNEGHGNKLVHGHITNGALSAAYKVHSRLGPGLLEKPYKACMAYEFARMGLSFEEEKPFPVIYEDITISLGYRVDFLVENEVIVELKSVETISPVHEAQLLSYLKLAKKRVGLLINFNVVRLRDGVRRRICGY